MANFIDDSINFGFGLFAYSREKLEQFVEKMVETGKVQKQDAQSVMHDLVEKGDEQRKELKKMIHDEMNDLGVSGGITKDDIREIVREELAKQKEEG